jgi:hypothetical protein
VIVDQTDDLPYKGYFYPDEVHDLWLGKLIDLVETLVEERKSGKEWTVLGRPLSAVYPPGREVSGYINDNIIGRLADTMRHMYECEVCGRIWLQMNPDRSEYVAYWPETPAVRKVLSAQGARPEPDERA